MHAVARSVGLIEINNEESNIFATGFLVGDNYFMTAYYVFKNR